MGSQKQSPSKLLYHEWVPTQLSMRVFFIVLPLPPVIVIVIFAYIFNCGELLLVSVPLLFLVLLGVNYQGIDIKITPKEIRVCFGIINRKRIPIKDIVACTPTQPDIRRYQGYFGLRWGIVRTLDGSRAYLAFDGLAVQIIPARGRAFVFSSKYPRGICDIIEELT